MYFVTLAAGRISFQISH